jgi:uncharacterized protein (TIGR00255 family)
MIQSMTGFGSASNYDFRVEVRSLNHRFIDISIKMPPYMSRHEIPLRTIIKEMFQRGRFDVFISTNSDKAIPFTIDKKVAAHIYSSLKSLQNELSLRGEITIETLSGYREILTEEYPDVDADALYAVFREAAANLEAMRIREGSLLIQEIGERITVLHDIIARIAPFTTDHAARWREKILERLKSVLGEDMFDSSRLLQEAALMADKLDISEEISRITNHLTQFREILQQENTIGKKLDFLLQEINREVNTMSCKAGDYTVSSLVVEMKTEAEKIREQIQNIQ